MSLERNESNCSTTQNYDAAVSERVTTWQHPFALVIGPFDVLVGRGSPAVNHGGNIRFRQMAQALKDRYRATRKRNEKDIIAKELISAVLVKGGRFLRRVESLVEAENIGVPEGKNAWVEVDEKIVMEKAKQALRDREVWDRAVLECEFPDEKRTSAATYESSCLEKKRMESKVTNKDSKTIATSLNPERLLVQPLDGSLIGQPLVMSSLPGIVGALSQTSQGRILLASAYSVEGLVASTTDHTISDQLGATFQQRERISHQQNQLRGFESFSTLAPDNIFGSRVQSLLLKNKISLRKNFAETGNGSTAPLYRHLIEEQVKICPERHTTFMRHKEFNALANQRMEALLESAGKYASLIQHKNRTTLEQFHPSVKLDGTAALPKGRGKDKFHALGARHMTRGHHALLRASSQVPADDERQSYTAFTFLDSVFLDVLCSFGVPVWSPSFMEDFTSSTDRHTQNETNTNFQYTWQDFGDRVVGTVRLHHNAATSAFQFDSVYTAARSLVGNTNELAQLALSLVEHIRRRILSSSTMLEVDGSGVSSVSTVSQNAFLKAGKRQRLDCSNTLSLVEPEVSPVSAWFAAELMRWGSTFEMVDESTQRPISLNICDDLFASWHELRSNNLFYPAVFLKQEELHQVYHQISSVTRLRSCVLQTGEISVEALTRVFREADLHSAKREKYAQRKHEYFPSAGDRKESILLQPLDCLMIQGLLTVGYRDIMKFQGTGTLGIKPGTVGMTSYMIPAKQAVFVEADLTPRTIQERVEFLLEALHKYNATSNKKKWIEARMKLLVSR